ncbi:MAG TPA: response regulator [Thermoanaerobaculia bacterium]|jgi:CheY-like chemotaxis protein
MAQILVVEDDDAIRQLLIEYLAERAALAVEGARDGVEALHQISTSDYAVVVLDLMMPHMSGIDLLDSLAAMEADPSVKAPRRKPAVIVITGAPPDVVAADDLTQRFPDTVRGVLRKPLDIETLTSRVAACCNGDS